MAAGKLDLYIEQGATFRKKLRWEDPQGTPVDNTGYTARMHIREPLANQQTIADLTTANGGIVLGGVNGEINLYLSDAATTAMVPSRKAVYDLEMVSGIGDVIRLVEGKVKIVPEVTR